MSSKYSKGQEPIPYQALLNQNKALLDENQALIGEKQAISDENLALQSEIESLKARLEEAEELKRAISEGDLDALIIPGPEGELIFTLDSADRAYRVLVETMNEGTATLAFDSTILYCNRRFAELVRIPSHAIVGTSIYQFIAPESTVNFNALLKYKMNKGEVNLLTESGRSIPVYLSISSLQAEGSPNAWCLVVTDLTEQKKNEEILASERLTRSIIEQSAETIIVCDTSGRITHFSNSMRRLCGCDPKFQRFENLINLKFSEGANAGKSILPASVALKGSTILGMEATFESENHQKLHLLLNSAPLKNKDGEIRGCVVTLTDITERKKTEEELQHAYARLRTIFDHKIDGIGIVIVNENGEVLEANDYYLRILGFSREELEAGVIRWVDATPPEWLSMDEKAISEFREHGVCTPYEKEYVRRDGSRIPVLIAGSMFPGERGEILGFVVDITERKLAEEALRESEEKYRTFFKNSIDAVLLTSPDGAVYGANPEACRIFEMTEEEIIRAGRNGVVDASDPRLLPALEERARVGKFKGELNYRRKDGTIFPGEVSTSIFIDKNGLAKTSMIIRDITKRKQEENRVRRYNSILEGINQIFRSAVWAEKEEELANVCLSVALEVTGRGIGFVNLIGDDGLLHDIAISKGGWDPCLTYDKIGYRHSPGYFVLHGLYGNVIKSGKGFFINVSPLNSESIGLPPCDPPLKSFLCVPLIQDGKTVGMLGVANREGGYSSEQQEDLEAIAPAIMQALNRKKEEQKRKQAEKALFEAYEELRVQNEELQTRSEELHKANQALLESEQRLQAIIDGSPGIVFMKDLEGRFILINKRLEELLGMTHDEIRGKTDYDIFPPEWAEYYQMHDREVLDTGVPQQMEEVVDLVDGRHIFLANKFPLYDVQGKPYAFCAISADITERKRLEEQIRQRAEELETIMEVAPVAIWIGHDEQCHNITGNKMANEFYEAETGENVSANVTPLRRFFYKGRELTAEEMPMQQSSLKDIDLRNVELDVLLQSGKWRVILGSASPLHDAEGQVRGSIGTFIDITERKRAEEALLKSENRFKILSEANALLLSSKDPVAMIQIIAEKVMRHLKCDVFFNYVFGKAQGRLRLNSCGGISPEAAKEIEWLDEGAAICGCVALEGCRIVSEDVQHNGDRRADLVRSMGIQAYACHPLHIGEKTIGTISFGTRSRKGFAEDELALMRTVADQVSVAIERKRAEEELKMALETLRFNEDQFRGLVMNVKSGAALIDEIGRFAVVNPSFMQIFGLDNELDILNVNSQDWSRWEVYGEDGKLLHVDDHPVRKVVSTGKPVKDQLVAVRNPGANELTWMLISAEPILKEDGHIYRMICTYHDITKRKKAEETLKKAHETLEEKVKERTAELEVAYNSLLEKELRLNEAQKIAHLGNWDWNLLTDKLHWSDEMYRIFGLGSLEFDATYRSFLNHVHPDDRNYVDNAVKKALNGEPYRIEYRIISSDGENHIVHSQAEVIFDEKHTPVRMRGVLQDITERKKAEEALEKIDKIRIKEIHHRIKNNLQVISSLLDLQAEKFEEERVREAFKEGQNRVISMALIHEELYKGEGTDRLNFSAYLKKLAQSLFHTYNLNSRNKHLRIDLEENAFFDIDIAVPLGIIVNELVSNSLKHAFIEDDKGEIRIHLSREEKNSEMHKTLFSLTVSDNGKGISEDLELESVETLGLQLVSILVDQLDGEVELKRMQGTEFRITFSIEEKFVFVD